MKFRIKKFITVKKILAAALIIAVGFFAYSKFKPKVIEIDSQKVAKSDVTLEVSTDGKITSGSTYTASFELGGTIVYQPFKVGDKISKGTRVASIDARSYRLAYDRALKDFNLQFSQLDEYDLSQKDKPVSDQSNLDRKQVDIPLQKSVSLFEDARNTLSKTSIYSPISGIVTSVNKKPGETIAATQPVITVQASNVPEFTGEIDDVDIVKVKIGQKVEIILDAYPDDKFNGIVSEIAPSKTKNDNGIDVYLVKIQFSNSDKIIYLDQNGQASIILNRQADVLNVPNSAIIEENNQKYVYVIRDSKAVKTAVTLGLVADFDSEIVSGLSEEDEISTSTNTLKDSIRVKTK